MRDDLQAIPEMKELGFETEYSAQDIMYNRKLPEVPHDAVSFKKTCGNIVEMVWKTSKGWTHADLIQGRYSNHTLYDSIESFIQDRKRVNEFKPKVPTGLKNYCVPDLKAKLDLITQLEIMRIEAIAQGDWKKAEGILKEIAGDRVLLKQEVNYLIEKVTDIERTGRTPNIPLGLWVS